MKNQKSKAKPVQAFKMKRPSIYRMLSNQQKKNIIALIDLYKMKYSQIGQSYMMNTSSVRQIYLTYKANGDKFIWQRHKAGRKPSEATIKATELVKQQKYLQSLASI